MSEQLSEPETSLILEPSPEECVELRYRVISLIDSANQGASFDGFSSEPFRGGAEFEKGAFFQLTNDRHARGGRLGLAYRADGYVDLFFRKSGPSKHRIAGVTRSTLCKLGGNQAEITERLGFASNTVPVAANQVSCTSLDYWNSLLDQIGEPTKPVDNPNGYLKKANNLGKLARAFLAKD